MILLFQISGFSWFMDLLFVLVSVSVDSFISALVWEELDHSFRALE